MANGNGTSATGKWAIGALTTLAFMLGGFAVGTASKNQTRQEVHEAAGPHGNVDQRLRAIELTMSQGSRLTGPDGHRVLRMISQLAKECGGEQAEAIREEADYLSREIAARPAFKPVLTGR